MADPQRDAFSAMSFATFTDATVGFTDATATPTPPMSTIASPAPVLPAMPMFDATGGLGTMPATTLATLPAYDALSPFPPTRTPYEPPRQARPASTSPAVARPAAPAQARIPAQRLAAPAPTRGRQSGYPQAINPTPARGAVVYAPAPQTGPGPTTPTPRRADVPTIPPTRRAGRKVAAGAAAGTGVLAKLGLLGKVIAVIAKLHLVGLVLSIAGYSLLFKWQFAIGLVVMIGLHELGHYFAMRKMGIQASLPSFVPFIGAYVRMRNKPRSVAQEALSALAGPATGAAVAGLALLIGYSYQLPLFVALGYYGFLLNLFNLIPVSPLDGGRVASALHPAVWLVALVVTCGFLMVTPSPVMALLAIGLAAVGIYRWRTHRTGGNTAYYAIEPEQRAQIGAAYLFVVMACVVGTIYAYRVALHV